MRKSKYTRRKDGLLAYAPTYKGQRKFFYGKTDAEIEAKVRKWQNDIDAGLSPSARTVNDLVDEYWAHKADVISPNSYNSFRSKLNDIRAAFGSTPVTDLDTGAILGWLYTYKNQGYAQKGISDRRSVLKCVLDYAVGKELQTNPCISLPSVLSNKPKNKRRPASEEDVKKIEAAKNDSLIAALFYFMNYAGCRIGEAAVLQEKDIDREHHCAAVYKDLAYLGQNPIVKDSAKTEAGERYVDLYDNVLEVLPHYEDPETYIFFPEGLPRKSAFETAVRNFRKKYGITATAHQLRHSYASLLHSAEIDPKDAQARLGHSSIEVTMDIYTDIEKEHNEKIRDKANAYIMERLGKKTGCPDCGSPYTKAEDGHKFKFCPDCGHTLQHE